MRMFTSDHGLTLPTPMELYFVQKHFFEVVRGASPVSVQNFRGANKNDRVSVFSGVHILFYFIIAILALFRSRPSYCV